MYQNRDQTPGPSPYPPVSVMLLGSLPALGMSWLLGLAPEGIQVEPVLCRLDVVRVIIVDVDNSRRRKGFARINQIGVGPVDQVRHDETGRRVDGAPIGVPCPRRPIPLVDLVRGLGLVAAAHNGEVAIARRIPDAGPPRVPRRILPAALAAV